MENNKLPNKLRIYYELINRHSNATAICGALKLKKTAVAFHIKDMVQKKIIVEEKLENREVHGKLKRLAEIPAINTASKGYKSYLRGVNSSVFDNIISNTELAWGMPPQKLNSEPRDNNFLGKGSMVLNSSAGPEYYSHGDAYKIEILNPKNFIEALQKHIYKDWKTPGNVYHAMYHITHDEFGKLELRLDMGKKATLQIFPLRKTITGDEIMYQSGQRYKIALDVVNYLGRTYGVHTKNLLMPVNNKPVVIATPFKNPELEKALDKSGYIRVGNVEADRSEGDTEIEGPLPVMEALNNLPETIAATDKVILEHEEKITQINDYNRLTNDYLLRLIRGQSSLMESVSQLQKLLGVAVASKEINDTNESNDNNQTNDNSDTNDIDHLYQ